MDWETTIEAVIDPALIPIVFQPIVDIQNDIVKGYEALSRFPVTDEGFFPPDIWFGEAHRLGVGVELEIAATAAALEFLPFLPSDTYMSINASADTIIVEPFVMTVLHRFPERIVIELTEHSVVRNYSVLRTTLDRIRYLEGRTLVRLGIDDVGAGASNLLHILNLEPDIIKIDRELIKGIDEDRLRQEAVRALTTFGKNLNVIVIAEGVETEAEISKLLELGVTHAQGYFLGEPAPWESDGTQP